MPSVNISARYNFLDWKADYILHGICLPVIRMCPSSKGLHCGKGSEFTRSVLEQPMILEKEAIARAPSCWGFPRLMSIKFVQV